MTRENDDASPGSTDGADAAKLGLGHWIVSGAFLFIIVFTVISVADQALRWSVSWFDRVDYAASPEQIAPVIEEIAECSPCAVHSIEIRGHEMQFIVRDAAGDYLEYRLRDKYRRKRVQLPRDGRFDDDVTFDPRIVQPEVLRELARDQAAKMIAIRERWGVGTQVCVEANEHQRRADGEAGSCNGKR